MKGIRSNIDVGGVLQTGREVEIRQSVILSEFASFQFPAPADVALRLRRVGHGLELQGTVEAVALGECARCLDDVRLALRLDIDERFEPGGDRDDPLGESNVLAGDDLDLHDLVRQVIDSALPLALLCNDDCKGLCADCGQKRDDCRCTHPE
ncbi:MAG: DUF177 domain-containing protein [Candidatus Eremiobacteraeota bacterium]|nr:DUF177 domain-containing protein [Candidatus Eremiobacteraeota bacterium]